MAAYYYADDANSLDRYGYGGANYSEYGGRRAAQARRYTSAALPYATGPDESFLNTSPSDYPRHSRDDRHSRNRPRSLPPQTRRQSRRDRDRSPSASSRTDSPRAVDPIRKARSLVRGTFSNSNSGLGVGVLGAIVGGLIARGAKDSTTQSRGHVHRREQERSSLISTALGAAVGGLGANAIERRIEKSRGRTADQQEAWEKKWRKPSRGRGTKSELDIGRSRRKSQQDMNAR